MPQTTEPLVEFRCPNDGRLLLKVSELSGVAVEVKCPRCRKTITAKLEESDG